MNLKAKTWAEALKPLLKQYKNKKHPLDYNNLYQLVVMVILSAQDSDKKLDSLESYLEEIQKPNKKHKKKK